LFRAINNSEHSRNRKIDGYFAASSRVTNLFARHFRHPPSMTSFASRARVSARLFFVSSADLFGATDAESGTSARERRFIGIVREIAMIGIT